jgi:hypothetical protein
MYSPYDMTAGYNTTSMLVTSSTDMYSVTTVEPDVLAVSKQQISVGSSSSSTSVGIQPALLKWVFVTVGTLGIVNNLVAMAVVLRVKKLRRQPRNWFIFHQSMADFVSAIFLIAIATRSPLTSFSVSRLCDVILTLTLVVVR